MELMIRQLCGGLVEQFASVEAAALINSALLHGFCRSVCDRDCRHQVGRSIKRVVDMLELVEAGGWL